MTDESPVYAAIGVVLREIVHGAAPDNGWLLNSRDPGLLRSLDRLSAEQASAVPPGAQASIAAHVDHLRYGLHLLNRWAHGEQPFGDADWTASWQRVTVDEEEWRERRDALRTEAERWVQDFDRRRDGGDVGWTGVIASAAHLAYHLGAIRQLDRTARGPLATESAEAQPTA